MADKVYGFCGTNKCKREVYPKESLYTIPQIDTMVRDLQNSIRIVGDEKASAQYTDTRFQQVNNQITALNSALTTLNNTINDTFNSFLVVEEKTGIATPNGTSQIIVVEMNVAKAGYTPIGVVGWQTSVNAAHISEMEISDNNLFLEIYRNNETHSFSWNAYVLYRKNL